MPLSPEEIAEMTGNSDVNISLEEAKFENITVPATIKSVESITLEGEWDNNGQGIRITYAVEAPIQATNGDLKQPGHILRPFPFKIKPTEMDPAKAAQQREYAFKDLARIAQAAGTLARVASATPAQIIAAVSAAEGKRVLLKLSIDKKGYQRIDAAAPGR
jgi:hypothetical protein